MLPGDCQVRSFSSSMVPKLCQRWRESRSLTFGRLSRRRVFFFFGGGGVLWPSYFCCLAFSLRCLFYCSHFFLRGGVSPSTSTELINGAHYLIGSVKCTALIFLFEYVQTRLEIGRLAPSRKKEQFHRKGNDRRCNFFQQ